MGTVNEDEFLIYHAKLVATWIIMTGYTTFPHLDDNHALAEQLVAMHWKLA